MTARLEPGRPQPLGATVDGDGVNLAVLSAPATRVEWCLFEGGREVSRLALESRTGDVWHGRLPGAGPGLEYGLRVHGPWDPQSGQRCNPHKLLLDPWSRQIVAPQGGFDGSDVHRSANHGAMDQRDNAAVAHRSRVVADDRPPRWNRPGHSAADLVLYEVHVRSFTKRMAGVPEHERGTYAGMASAAAVSHLQRLGVTAVSLLPVMQKLDEPQLLSRGMVNHWGYNTMGFFCPEPRYAATEEPRREFREMVQRLHAAGIEVLLDVVFNHTAEADEYGPTLAWRGLDNAGWYRLKDGAGYENWSGCGNTLDIGKPHVREFVLASMRFWVEEMGADGFRFDLAPVLGRDDHAFDRHGAFFAAVSADPVLRTVRLIAEPWDLGPSGYQLGGFPDGWMEWNDRFRDTVRAFWLGGDSTRGDLARRLTGSSDRFDPARRSPFESVNYVVSHDGFDLADLVSYDVRHNEANGEGGTDGQSHNLSWNCGWEGPTSDPEVTGLRNRLRRSLLATTILSQGTPMLAAGDEIGHTQQGNNNPYCQDNEITWLDWDQADHDLAGFVAHVVALRSRLLPFGAHWYSGQAKDDGHPDLAWLRRTGGPLTPEDWENRMSRVLGVRIGAPGRSPDPLLLLLNGGADDAEFALPAGAWMCELDSTTVDGRSAWRQGSDDHVVIPARGLLLLRDAADHTMHQDAAT